jgi:hypothetical protein
VNGVRTFPGPVACEALLKNQPGACGGCFGTVCRRAGESKKCREDQKYAFHLVTTFAGWLGALGAVVPVAAGTPSHPPPKALIKTTVATTRWPSI